MHGGFKFVFGQVACPNDDDLPAGVHQFVVVLFIPGSIPFYLVLPEGRVGFRQYELSASLINKEFYVYSANSRGVLTPHTIHWMLFRYACSASSETSVDKDCRSVLAHNNIRLRRFAAEMRHAAVAF